jgi:anthranilate phosphoribosyltransferase
MQRMVGPLRGRRKSDGLAHRVDPGVRAPSCVGDGPAAEDAFENPLEFDLNRTSGWLSLPPDKAGAVVVQLGEEGPAHGPEFSRAPTPEQGCNCLSRLTKGAAAGYTFQPPPTPREQPLTRAGVPSVIDPSALRFALRQVAQGRSLQRSEAAAAFDELMKGAGTPGQAAALLMGLKVKGETADEIAGAAQALRRAMLPVAIESRDTLVDTCGTGGGRVGTVNISTAAALIVAGAGVPVAKHGNRSYTSRCGSADVLEALGINIELGPAQAAEVLRSTGVAFMFAPIYHPAMRHLAPVRKELGVPTIMNLLGPLANPAGVVRQVVGVADSSRAPLVADALSDLGARHALVLHAVVGMDEISPAGGTFVWEVKEGTIRTWELDPASLGLGCDDLEGLAGGDPSDNAEAIEELLAGAGGAPLRCAALLNAAAALYVAGRGWSFEEAAVRGQESLESGAAAAALGRLRAAAPRATARA